MVEQHSVLSSIVNYVRAISAENNNSVVLLGVCATTFIVTFTLVYSSLFDYVSYTGWVAFIWMTAVPVQVILGLHMQFSSPKIIANLSQPLRGLAYTFITLVLMLIGGGFLYLVPGGMEMPGPFLIMATIIVIVIIFWLVAVWQGWPFSIITINPWKQGLLVFIAGYTFGYIFYCLCFDFSFMVSTAVYSTALDPKGYFNAWYVLSFSVTTVAVVMVMSLFDFWPCTIISTKQPVQGIVVTIFNLTISTILFWTVVFMAEMDPVDFMVRVSVSIIFGVFLVTNMMQFKLFNQLQQPLRGMVLLGITLIIGYFMQLLYRNSIPYLTDNALQTGSPTYETELWVATALLSITFPLINFVSGYFSFWPLVRNE